MGLLFGGFVLEKKSETKGFQGGDFLRVFILLKTSDLTSHSFKMCPLPYFKIESQVKECISMLKKSNKWLLPRSPVYKTTPCPTVTKPGLTSLDKITQPEKRNTIPY